MKISGIGFVYMITSPSGRIYVGSTNDFEYRINYYKLYSCKGQIKLYNSFIKHGVENHTFEIVWAGDINEMLKYETLIGWGFNVLEPENLNLKLPRLGETYRVISDETRLKMSISNKKSFTEERRKIQSESMKGEKHFLFGKSSHMLGKKHSQETKIKISNANKNRTDNWRNKLSEAHKGKQHSEETKLKMSIAAKGKIKNKMIREFIEKNNVQFIEGSRNSSIVILIGYGQFLNLTEQQLKEQLKKEIDKDSFLSEEISRIFKYCEDRKYKDFWSTKEAKSMYKF